MHVAYIHQHFSTRKGATGTRSYEMGRRMIQAGHRVTMICGQYAAGDGAVLEKTGNPSAHAGADEFDVDGIRVIRIREPYANQMGFVRRLLAFGRFARAATRIVARLDVDLVFATSTPLSVGIPGMKGARRLGVPFVFEVRDLWPELPIAMGVLRNPLLIAYARRLERRIYRAASRIITLAPGMKEGILRTGYPPDRIELIPNSADLDLFRPCEDPITDNRFGPPGACRFVFTGAHGKANGLDAVLDAAAVLTRRGDGGVHFVFIGEGSERERLMTRCKSEGLEAMMSWLRPMPKSELARILPRMDVGLMILRNVPAFYNGTSPNKFFDYIASGLPVLNNYPGWLAEMIREQDCGMVVPPDDPSAFADAVVRLRDDALARREMGRRARRLAEDRFSRDQLADQFVTVLEAAYADSTTPTARNINHERPIETKTA